MESEKIKIEGHNGTWYVIDEKVLAGEVLYLLESEQHGDEAPAIIVDEQLNVVKEDVLDGFAELNMSEEQLAEKLSDVLYYASEEEEGSGLPEVRNIRTYADAGLLTRNKGIVVYMRNGQEFQLTIQEVRK